MTGRILLSVVVPVYNESGNIAPLAAEIAAALAERPPGSWELILVDDGSGDSSGEELLAAAARYPAVRVLRHAFNAGQSAAVASGFTAARGIWLVTLDGDGQNDPADIIPLLDRAATEKADCVTGVRVRRRDTRLRRISSRIANAFRNGLTGDTVRDSACGIRVIRRTALGEIPVFNGMHRFLPTLLRAQGFTVVEQTVNHRERKRGNSKYGMHNRLWRGIRDCFAIRWYKSRAVAGRRLHPSRLTQQPEITVNPVTSKELN